jgi:cytochrome P450
LATAARRDFASIVPDAPPLERPNGPTPVGRNPVRFAWFLRNFSKDPMGFIQGRLDQYGDTYFTISGGAPLFVTRELEVMRDVLVRRASDFEKRKEDLASFLGEGLLNADGATWRRHRRMIQPAFARDRLRAYAAVFVRRTKAWLDVHRDGEIIELEREMTALTLEIVCEALFAHDVGGRAVEFGRTMDRIQDGLNVFLPEWLPTPGRIRQRFAQRRLDRVLDELIEAKRAAPGPDLISRLLEAEDEEGKLSDQQVRDEVVTLFAAGHETTALALTWTLHHLARNPEATAQLRDEVRSVLGARAPTFDDLTALRWTEACILESMRLEPPAYVIPRRAVRATQAGPWSMREGDEIVMWIFHLHRDPRHFADPLRWTPERFIDAKTPEAYMPFGAGQRACIGRHFAMVEAQLVLATLAQRFTFERIDRHAVGFRPKITLAPGRPIRARLRAVSTER